jgi:ribosomal protein S18 acetylase RimI-like enzyme
VSQQALNPEQFRFAFRQAKPRSMDAQADRELMYHRVDVFHTPTEEATSGRAGHAGYVMWHHRTGEIGNISTSPEYQRQGVATATYRHAQGIASETRGVRPPRHSPQRTAAGDKWARSLGERLPRSDR